MTITRLLTATAAAALIGGLCASTAGAQTPATAKTEAAAKVATGKASTDAPAATAVQGTAKAVQQGAAPAVAATPAPAAGAAPMTSASANPVAVSGDLMQTLRASGQFNTFVAGIDATNLSGLLKSNANLTVFAPTDAAFAAMPPADLARLKADKAAMQKFILHHVVNAPVPSTKIKGAKGPVATGAGDQLLLDGSDPAGALKVDGATIVQADLKTGSGLLQVVDHVLVSGQGDTSTTAAASTGASTGASATTTTTTTTTAPAPKKP